MPPGVVGISDPETTAAPTVNVTMVSVTLVIDCVRPSKVMLLVPVRFMPVTVTVPPACESLLTDVMTGRGTTYEQPPVLVALPPASVTTTSHVPAACAGATTTATA